MEKKIDSNNIGYKLLKSMGWKEGKSLGKTNQGLLEPIKIDILSKISKEPNKNYKGKNNKKNSKNNFTLSSFKSKLYNSKESLNQKKNNENEKLTYVNKENLISLFNDKNKNEEKEIKKNLNILINLFYNKYYIENEKDYLFLKHNIEQKCKKLNDDFIHLSFEDKMNFDHPINYNLNRLEEIINNIESYYESKVGMTDENHEYSNDIIMNSSDNRFETNGLNNLNEISLVMSYLLELENFIIDKNMKALTEEIIYKKDNNYQDDFSMSFCNIYFDCIGKLSYFLKNIITYVFFYCSECCINFDCYEEFENHRENDCGLDLSDN